MRMGSRKVKFVNFNLNSRTDAASVEKRMTRRNTNAQTEHSKRLRMETANARIERLKSEGWERKTVLLPPESLDIIEHKKAEHGGISGVIIAALKKL